MCDKGLDYFENSRRATLANRAYAIANPQGWADCGKNVRGLTASDIPSRYRARGVPPPENDDGTITLSADGGSFAFTPDQSLEALRHMYDAYRTKIWGPYGFKDAFNPSMMWFASDYLGIDQGPIVLMIENYRTAGIWKVFMQHAAIQRGLARARFLPVIEAKNVQHAPDIGSEIRNQRPNLFPPTRCLEPLCQRSSLLNPRRHPKPPRQKPSLLNSAHDAIFAGRASGWLSQGIGPHQLSDSQGHANMPGLVAAAERATTSCPTGIVP